MDLPQNAGTFRIVGVVEDAKFAGWGLDKPARPMFYVPLAQTVNYHDPLMARVEASSHFARGVMLVTSTPPGVLEPVLTKLFAEVDPNLTVTSVRTMSQLVALSFDQERMVATLASLFGAVALLLAAVGLYGVVAHTVTLRTTEIGLRMALGADQRRVIGLVLAGAFTRVVVGLVLGLPLAVGAGRFLATRLYGVPYWDPLALTLASGALALAALVAALIPARRASTISPMNVLRGI
jgi:hypothetical protein